MRGVSHAVLQLTPGMVGEERERCVCVCVFEHVHLAYSIVGLFEGGNQTLN